MCNTNNRLRIVELIANLQEIGAGFTEAVVAEEFGSPKLVEFGHSECDGFLGTDITQHSHHPHLYWLAIEHLLFKTIEVPTGRAAPPVATLRMHGNQKRFVELVGYNGTPICAPIFVEIGELSYLVSDAEWESRAIAIAIHDGLLNPNSRGSVHAKFRAAARG